jgi:hypothetical protein
MQILWAGPAIQNFDDNNGMSRRGQYKPWSFSSAAATHNAVSMKTAPVIPISHTDTTV